MKKTLLVSTGGIIVVCLMLALNLITGIQARASENSVIDDPQDIPSKVREGYKVGRDKSIATYEIVKYGWIGAFFTKRIPIYEYKPCCYYTGEKMDGCSAPSICKSK